MAAFKRKSPIIPGGSTAIFLGWIVGVMAYLAVIACAWALFASSISERWSDSLAGAMTVQIPRGDDRLDASSEATRLKAAREILATTPGLLRQSVLDPARTRALLSPWVDEPLVEGLPLPSMIDIRVDPAAGVGPKALQDRLTQVIPGAIVDDHGRWLERVAALTSTVARAGWLVLTLVGLVAVASVIFAVVSGLSENRETVAVLQLIGAYDSYIARRFQRYILKIAVPACILGTLFGVGSFFLVGEVLREMDDPVLRFSALASLDRDDWLRVGIVPVGFVILSALTARFSALVALRGSA